MVSAFFDIMRATFRPPVQSRSYSVELPIIAGSWAYWADETSVDCASLLDKTLDLLRAELHCDASSPHRLAHFLEEQHASSWGAYVKRTLRDGPYAFAGDQHSLVVKIIFGQGRHRLGSSVALATRVPLPSLALCTGPAVETFPTRFEFELQQGELQPIRFVVTPGLIDVLADDGHVIPGESYTVQLSSDLSFSLVRQLILCETAARGFQGCDVVIERKASEDEPGHTGNGNDSSNIATIVYSITICGTPTSQAPAVLDPIIDPNTAPPSSVLLRSGAHPSALPTLAEDSLASATPAPLTLKVLDPNTTSTRVTGSSCIWVDLSAICGADGVYCELLARSLALMFVERPGLIGLFFFW